MFITTAKESLSYKIGLSHLILIYEGGPNDFSPTGLAQLVATLVGSTKLLYAGPG